MFNKSIISLNIIARNGDYLSSVLLKLIHALMIYIGKPTDLNRGEIIPPGFQFWYVPAAYDFRKGCQETA